LAVVSRWISIFPCLKRFSPMTLVFLRWMTTDLKKPLPFFCLNLLRLFPCQHFSETLNPGFRFFFHLFPEVPFFFPRRPEPEVPIGIFPDYTNLSPPLSGRYFLVTPALLVSYFRGPLSIHFLEQTPKPEKTGFRYPLISDTFSSSAVFQGPSPRCPDGECFIPSSSFSLQPPECLYNLSASSPHPK